MINLSVHSASFVAIALYMIASAYLLRRDSKSNPGPLYALICAAVLAHALSLSALGLFENNKVISLGPALSLFAWQCCALHVLCCLRLPLWHLGRVIWLFAAACLVVSLMLPLPGDRVGAALSAGMRSHILLSLLAYSFLTLAAVQAVTYALQDAKLHRGEHRIPLPPLQTSEDLTFKLLSYGFALLCLAVASGLFFVENIFAQHLAHKTVLSLLACLLFGALLLGRQLRGWRGRQAVRWTLGAYASLILAYFGAKIVLEQILGRNWG